ncbi:hypothetical protein BDV29DRAFT_158513 [Aspergillus leporis]|jgi:nitrate reductase (NAD(P)H)|uniref:Oxidoreductase FAD/NAD(P)-binding domain-containing protein n=1 Tax=Aspergillus leporis TaxID=41062 RepID=A0A5N5WZD0_9EURO|nr:hypothetical protein BDV29DRAFT_158513 [Aspergillus leporis]
MSNVLDCLREGEEVEAKGPSGAIRHQGHGRFAIDDRQHTFDNVSLVLGGLDVAPGHQVIARILKDKTDKTKARAIDANKSEDDILLVGDLDEFSRTYKDQFEIVHMLSHHGDDWKGHKDCVNEEIINQHVF